MSVVAAQLVLGFTALIVVAVWPPAVGQMMLVPLDGANADKVFVGAASAGARVIGPGSLPRSWVVSGDRSRLLAQFSRWRMLAVAPAMAGCAAGVAG